MTLAQEAYLLINQQPEANLRAIVELLKCMPTRVRTTSKRTGIANDKYVIDAAFDKNFDAMDEEIAGLFDGEAL